MTDIRLVWDEANGRGDWVLGAGDLQTGSDLETAVLLSLFTDRVLPVGQVPPDGTDDPRGWWADTYEPSPIGSRLWTLKRAVKSASTLSRARDYAREALAWLIDDGVVRRVDVFAEWQNVTRLALQITLTGPDGAISRFRYAWAWGAA